MSERIKVIPKPGLTVLNPKNFAKIPAEGKFVVSSLYWKRLEKQGAVKIVQAEDEGE